MKGARRVFHRASTRLRLPITKDILQKITAPQTSQPDKDSLNFTTACIVAFAGFLRMGEFTYTRAEAAKTTLFKETRLTRCDIKFFGNDDYATLFLRRSKTDHRHEGVTIVLSATRDSTCPVAALRQLFEQDPKPESAPLFGLTSGSFSRQEALKELNSWLLQVGILPKGFLGHSFRKGAAQEAYNNGLTQEEI